MRVPRDQHRCQHGPPCPAFHLGSGLRLEPEQKLRLDTNSSRQAAVHPPSVQGAAYGKTSTGPRPLYRSDTFAGAWSATEYLNIVSRAQACKFGLITYMHSAWNSCPQGRLITLLCPSTYSSRHTTHSTCLPVYLRCHRDVRELDFSLLGSSTFDGPAAPAKTPDIVCDRGRVGDTLEREPSKGEVGMTERGLPDRTEPADDDDDDDDVMV
jgi:hypothetical protein